MISFQILGLMSGTSLDGLDIALCSFSRKDDKWDFNIKHSDTKPYTSELLETLRNAKLLGVEKMLILDKKIGAFCAEKINQFCVDHDIDKNSIDLVVSHGQTIFHQPEKGFTYQIGCGDTISYLTGIPTLNDVRQKDIIAGGQGAPLVPIGEKYLFHGYDGFVNIGGFTNISVFATNQTIAFDICPGNLPLNHFSILLGKPYDLNGDFAKLGVCDSDILVKLNSIDYYSNVPPKSLGTEWLDNHFYPCFPEKTDPKNALSTLCEHISTQIADTINRYKLQNVLFTGGGTHNSHLIDLVKNKTNATIKIPNKEIIDYKEALIFAFIGARYLTKENTTIGSVTGAKSEVISGVLHIP